MRISKKHRRIKHDKHCTICGTRYTVGYALSKYCKPACRQAAYRRREKELKKLYSELDKLVQ